MELQNIFQKKIKRKNFFAALAVTTAGFLVMKTIPFKIIGKKLLKTNSDRNNIKIKVNSLAVSRRKEFVKQPEIGGTNV